MSQISDSEIEDIMIEIQKMNLNETKKVVTPQIPLRTSLHTNNHLPHESTNKIHK